tara:strand:+ start:961 stop:1419 length:459 start_codon:yes stop_codon:yes gene_type:complete
MKKIIIFIHLFFILNYVALAHDYSKEDIEIDHPIIKVVKLDSKVGAGYMKIINKSNKKIKLISLEANIAKTQEIHEVIIENDVYKMRPINNGISIKPKEILEFKSKSYHFMFFNFNKNLEDNGMLDAKLVFDKELVIPIKFKVIIGNNEHHH